MYSSFAHEFSKTRTRPWPCVAAFLSSFPTCDRPILLDAGCGNGRNLVAAAASGFDAEGFDVCPEFVEICRSRGLTVTSGNIESPTNPITNKYDAILCIAVLHHLRSDAARQRAMGYMYEALNPGGAMLVTVWSVESDGARFPKTFCLGDNEVPWQGSASRYYYIYDKPTIDRFLDEFRAIYPASEVTLSWEEQNWIVNIKKPV